MFRSAVKTPPPLRQFIALASLAAAAFGLVARLDAAEAPGPFHLEEATIDGMHDALQGGQTTCQQIVQAYVNRAKAYNGMCTALITKDGKSIPAVQGVTRAGAPVKFPTRTVGAATIFPNYDQYAGLPMELGRMEPTITDPTIPQQYGMRVGIPNAGQLNALETLNIRGERSQSCKKECDAHPSKGALPASCPAVCEDFRKQPDALERAAELDKQYGTNPDLGALPMYCVVMSIKNWYDAKDMRGTGGWDVNFGMDVPKFDSPDVADLRGKGAIIYAIATANAIGGASGSGPEKAKSVFIAGNTAYGVWGGQTCNPYDTERVPRGTSNGSGVSVAANLVNCSICEQTQASCKGPASRNNHVNLLTTKGVTMDGGVGYGHSGDRAGIHCRTVKDAVMVLDAVKGYDSEDMFTTLAPGLIPKEPYTSFVVSTADVPKKPLQGMRIAVVREFMVKHTQNDVAISDQIDKEIKTVLRDKLGADLVETIDPMYPDDPEIQNLKYTFADAFAEILPHNVPEYFWQKSGSELEFAVPGWDVTTVDYAVALAMGAAPLSDKLNLRRISSGLSNPRSPFQMNKYLRQRGDERIRSWADWVANAKFESEAEAISGRYAIDDQDNRADGNGINYLKMQTVLRMIVQKVMTENGIDAFVNPENTLPPFKLGGPTEPTINNRATASCCGGFTALLGGPEIDVPAGYNRIVYEPQYVLSADKKRYESVTGAVQSLLPQPMPISLMVWGGAGADPAVIKTASAYEAATHHRVPPSAFGPLKGEP